MSLFTNLRSLKIDDHYENFDYQALLTQMKFLDSLSLPNETL